MRQPQKLTMQGYIFDEFSVIFNKGDVNIGTARGRATVRPADLDALMRVLDLPLDLVMGLLEVEDMDELWVSMAAASREAKAWKKKMKTSV